MQSFTLRTAEKRCLRFEPAATNEFRAGGEKGGIDDEVGIRFR